MRQAGLLAAACLYALDHHRTRLADDHANAKLLAEGLARIPGIECDPATVETNIVIFRTPTTPAADFCQRLHDAGLWLLPRTTDSARAVTHLHITRQQILDAIEIVRSSFSG
jgi:threonine aldolase